jgi:8-oxo-dGTP diphosphatase
MCPGQSPDGSEILFLFIKVLGNFISVKLSGKTRKRIILLLTQARCYKPPLNSAKKYSMLLARIYKLVRKRIFVYQPILATLCYIVSPDRQRVLMIHRNKRSDDIHYGKYNGLGGKLQQDEDVITGLRREIFEEAGIVVEQAQLRGTISWPGFGKRGEDWFGFIFRVDGWSGEVHSGNHEGTLEWVPITALRDIPLWPSDYEFLPMVFDADPRPFHGSMPFKDGQMVSWSYHRI